MSKAIALRIAVAAAALAVPAAASAPLAGMQLANHSETLLLDD
jgi:hypothetical protein